MRTRLFLLPSLCLQLFGALPAAADFTYVTVPKDYVEIPNTTFEVSNLPPVKDQDTVGVCYAATGTILLEHHNCKTRRTACKGRDVDERLSLIDVAGYASGSLVETGSTYNVLKNIHEKAPKIAKESCAPFDSLVLTKTWSEKGQNLMLTSQGVGLAKLREIYEKGRTNTICIDCVEEVRRTFADKIKADFGQVLESFQAPTFEKFALQLLIPKACRETGLKIPSFRPHYYPAGNKTPDAASIRDLLIRNIRNEVPTSIAFCTEEENGSCKGGHAVVVTGVKQLCNSNGCKIAFRIQNSYGTGWQERHDNGWLDGDWLIQKILMASIDKANDLNLIVMDWVESPLQRLEEYRTPIYQTPPRR